MLECRAVAAVDMGDVTEELPVVLEAETEYG
jgi:hypothetical protein